MSEALVFDSCFGRSKIHSFVKKSGCVFLRTDLSIKGSTWLNRSGVASPSATQHSLIHSKTNDRLDRWFRLLKKERVGFELILPFRSLLLGFALRDDLKRACFPPGFPNQFAALIASACIC